MMQQGIGGNKELASWEAQRYMEMWMKSLLLPHSGDNMKPACLAKADIH